MSVQTTREKHAFFSVLEAASGVTSYQMTLWALAFDPSLETDVQEIYAESLRKIGFWTKKAEVKSEEGCAYVVDVRRAALIETHCSSSEVDPRAALWLSVGEGRKIGPRLVELVGIDEDSRCPLNTNCFWMGQALARLKVTEGGKTSIVQLSTQPAERKSAWSLVQVSPLRMTDKAIEPADYKALVLLNPGP